MYGTRLSRWRSTCRSRSGSATWEGQLSDSRSRSRSRVKESYMYCLLRRDKQGEQARGTAPCIDRQPERQGPTSEGERGAMGGDNSEGGI